MSLYCLLMSWFSLAVHAETARDADRLAGDERSVVAGQEGHDAGVVVRHPDAPEWYAAHHRVADLLPLFARADEGVHRGRVGRAGADGVDGHACARHLARQR